MLRPWPGAPRSAYGGFDAHGNGGFGDAAEIGAYTEPRHAPFRRARRSRARLTPRAPAT